MGVEYRYLLIPRDNTHRPDSSAVERLIRAWRDHDFAVQPGSPRHAAMNFRTHSASTRMRRRQAHPFVVRKAGRASRTLTSVLLTAASSSCNGP